MVSQQLSLARARSPDSAQLICGTQRSPSRALWSEWLPWIQMVQQVRWVREGVGGRIRRGLVSRRWSPRHQKSMYLTWRLRLSRNILNLSRIRHSTKKYARVAGPKQNLRGAACERCKVKKLIIFMSTSLLPRTLQWWSWSLRTRLRRIGSTA